MLVQGWKAFFLDYNGEYKKLFGWETDGHGDEYLGFMGEFLTELVAVLKKHNVYENTYFHHLFAYIIMILFL